MGIPHATELTTMDDDFAPVIEEALGQSYLVLTEKQRQLMDAFFKQVVVNGKAADIEGALRSAGVSYSVLESLRAKGCWQGFVKWLGRKALEKMMLSIPAIVAKVSEQAIAGKAAQQKMALQMTGLLVKDDVVSGGYSPVKIVKKFMVTEKDGKLTASAEISTEETA